ncbi:MAG: DUF2085 domain-containing protein [Ignavibacteriales bacterium]|nr:DUF2085 domain-containing protein [Ignavibacteriales bacterium]
MSDKSIFRFLLLGTFFWCLTILLPPILVLFNLSNEGAVIMSFYSRICHQLDSHSIHLFGNPLAVCARCSSIYFSFFLGVLVWKKFSHTPTLLPKESFGKYSIFFFPKVFIFLLPMLFDVFINSIEQNFPYSNVRRIVTGIIFGFPFGISITPLFIQSIKEIFSANKNNFKILQS